jgi:hypothetical protein
VPTAELARQPSFSAALLGECADSLRSVLNDVFDEFGVRLDPDVPAIPPDLVVAIVEHNDATAILTAAKLLAGGAPIVVIIAIGDDRLVNFAIMFGAAACYAMDTPLDCLRDVLRAVLGVQAAPPPARNSWPSRGVN